MTDDQAAVEDVVRTFLAAFSSGPDSPQHLDALRAILLPQAVLVATCGRPEPVVHDVDGFIAPRAALLSGGALVDFHEWVLAGRTDVFGDVAAWFGGYAKEGVQDGVAFTGRGMKSVQLVRTAQGWRISAVAWDDERDGLSLP